MDMPDLHTLLSKSLFWDVDFEKIDWEKNASFLVEDNIRLITIEDIAPMKLDAITGRGKKKDFFHKIYKICVSQ